MPSRTTGACTKRSSQRSAVLMAGMLCLLGSQVASGQIYDGLTPQQANELRQYDFLQRTRMNDQRVDRQVEVSRLEGRIMRLEEQMRGVPHPNSTAQLAMVLALLDEQPAPIAGDPLAGDPPRTDEASASPTGSGDRKAPAAETPSTTTPSEARQTLVRQQVVRELVGRDYLASLEISIADTKVDLLELTGELTSLQRLSAKGLASGGQLELASLKRRRAELQLTRLEQQRSGIQRLFPQFTAATQDSPTEPKAELPQPAASPNANAAPNK
jgi:hypothetical protein